MKLTRLETLEFTLILGFVPLLGWIVHRFPLELPLGKWVGFAAALMLLQSLFRDVVLWWQQRRQDKSAQRKIGCLCAESTVGLTLVFAAIAMSLFGAQKQLQLSGLEASVWAGSILLVGFLTKNYVVIIRKEKNHGSINVW